MAEPRRCPQCAAEIPPNSPVGLCPRCLLLAASDSQPAEDSAREPTKLSPRGAGFVPPTPEELAPLFPQLEILELLGKGGMGAVYKARQTALDRMVAVKILSPEISHDPAFAERFQREARALAKLSHPHIVAVYDFGQSGGLCHIVMEFVEGANLRQAIQTGTLNPPEALAIVPQICEALQFAHDEGIVHRDIKPENILIDKRGRVKIADFGLAKLLGQESGDHSLTGTQQVMGTLRYMAPEQMRGSRAVDHRADIYSLGVVFYELLTGELPLGKFALPSKRVQIDVRLDEVVLRALEQEPAERYQYASDVKWDVETISRSDLSARTRDPSLRASAGSGSRSAATPTAAPEIRRQLLGPAILLMLFGLGILFPMMLCFATGLNKVGGIGGRPPAEGWGLLGLSLFLLVIVGLVVRGAWHMLAVESYPAAVLGSLLAQPVGIWGLFVLSRPEVKAAFGSRPRSVAPTAAFEIRRKLLVPAILLILFGLGLLFPIVLCFFNGLDMADGNDASPAAVGWALMGFALFLLVISGLVLRGAWHMLAVESYRAAVLGSLLAQPVGLWGLFVLSRPDVKSVFGSRPPPLVTHPHFSRFAIAGAVWALLGVLTVIPVLYFIGLNRVWNGTARPTDIIYSEPPAVFSVFMGALLAVGAGAPLGTTIFGAVAIGHIKRSGGKLLGLPLAVADAVFFPLVLLDGLLLLLVVAQPEGFDNPLHLARVPSVAWLLVISFIGWIDFLIVRAVWRTASGFVPSTADRASGGTPLTQLRFAVSGSQDVPRQAIFHFSALGYHLLEQQPDVCVFQRGGKWSGLWEMDIRKIHTILTVRTVPAADGLRWVSCDWSVRTLGGWITRGDIRKLEDEGHGFETLLSGPARSDSALGASPDPVSQPDRGQTAGPDAPVGSLKRPGLVPVFATLNLAGAIGLMLVCAMEKPPAFAGTMPRIWQVWETVDNVLGFASAAALFAASIGLYLWKPWARKFTLAVCVFGLGSFVFDAPYLARFAIPDLHADIQHTLATEGVDPDLRDLMAITTMVILMGGVVAITLTWLIGQLVYFTRPNVVAMFESPGENPGRFEWLFTARGATAALLCLFGPLLLSLGLVALFDGQTKRSISNQTSTVPPLGTITSGIGAEFTVPAGQVAVFEVVTRRDNATVPVPLHCGYVMAPPDRNIRGTFRWARKPQEESVEVGQPIWNVEIRTDGAGGGQTDAPALPAELNAVAGVMSLGLGLLTPNEEVIHWVNADADNLPANGLIGLRMTVVAHGTNSGGTGCARIDWKKAQAVKSTSRRKLSSPAP